MTVYRLPDVNPCLSTKIEQIVQLHGGRDNPLYASVITEDGHQAWSNPIYAVPMSEWMLLPGQAGSPS